MKRSRAIIVTVSLLTGLLGLGLSPTRVGAAAMPIPAPLYPANTHLSQLAPLSNQQMDCLWGFACHNGQPALNAPVFHLTTQDDLHRLSGWAQFGDTKGSAGRMLFAVYASRYSPDSAEGMPWNVRAFADFRGSLMVQHWKDVSYDRIPRLIPAGQVGNKSEQMVLSSDGDVIAMSCWVGSVEVEGVAVYAHGSVTAHRIALRSLTRQIRAATSHEL